MFNDATSSTPIPVFTTANDSTKNENKNPLQNVTTDLTGENKFTPVKSENQNPLQKFLGCEKVHTLKIFCPSFFNRNLLAPFLIKKKTDFRNDSKKQFLHLYI